MSTHGYVEPHVVFDHIAHIASAFRLASLTPQLETCKQLLSSKEQIEVAVFGRFKAGKSSFLNSIAGIEVLPVGVVPVTSVITKLSFGERPQATVHYLDGSSSVASLHHVAEFISEAHNPENRKGVATVEIALPQLAPYRGITFVDTPGLGSAFQHNTATSMEWLARVGAALVAVSVDPPLTDQDLQLIRELQRFTPKIVVLLTKADLLSPAQLEEVVAFVRAMLAEKVGRELAVFPFSINEKEAGFRETLDQKLFAPLREHVTVHAEHILQYKLSSLLQQLVEYLEVARTAAEASEQERHVLRSHILGERHEGRLLTEELRLVKNTLLAETRPKIMERLRARQSGLQEKLARELEANLQQWRGNLWELTRRFEEWLYTAVPAALTDVSLSEQSFFASLLENAQRAFSRLIESFHHRLAERVERVLGIRLTAPVYELAMPPPRTPSIYIGNVFDHHLDLLWFLIPMTLFGGMMKQHLRGKLPEVLEKGVSRLATQWADSLNTAIERMAAESQSLITMEVTTIEDLLRRTPSDLATVVQLLTQTQELQEPLRQRAMHGATRDAFAPPSPDEW
jgi:GTP-binding protein EngB required for normal cell division